MRDIFNSPRLTELKKRRRKNFLNKVYISLCGFIVIFIFLAYISHINKLNISGIEVTGNTVIDGELVKSVTDDVISGNYLWIFPKTNIFFYPKTNIENTLHQKYKRINDIKISLKNNSILVINITERQPKYTWCGNTPTETNGKKEVCYFTDENGYVFDIAPYFSGDVYFKLYGKISSIDDPTGNNYFPESFKKLLTFKEILEKLNLKPSALYVGENEDVKILLLKGSNATTPPEVRFKISADITKVAENLDAALKTEPLQTDYKKKYSSLLYVDLRFGNKVYYKFRP